jgi:uncharacterized protein YndB with AHSA1/START domain
VSTDATIILTRVYDAPRARVWEAITEPRHIVQWWGGAGVENPVCEIDLRPGGIWHHVMRFPGGHEMVMDFVFVEIAPPGLLVWRHADHDTRRDGAPVPRITVTLEDLGAQTRWRMVAQFLTPAARDAALAMGFTGPIEASGERLVAYLPTI